MNKQAQIFVIQIELLDLVLELSLQILHDASGLSVATGTEWIVDMYWCVHQVFTYKYKHRDKMMVYIERKIDGWTENRCKGIQTGNE